MSTALRLTLDEYDQMIADGAFDTLRDLRIELIHGELRERTPPRPVEIADSSLDSDMGEKADLYAAAGIADYWVVNLPGRCVEVFRRPVGGKYAEHTTHPLGQEIRPLAFPEVVLSTTELFTTGPMEE